MFGKRLSAVVFLAVLAAACVTLLLSSGLRREIGTFFSKSNVSRGLEEQAVEAFPGAEVLRRLRISLNYWSGNKEQNGIFITDDALMLDVQPESQAIITSNTSSMMDYMEQLEKGGYVMIIPTACAVQQEKLPYESVVPLYNQKEELIDDIYRRVSGYLTAVDVYPTLRNHQEEYIYYRTDTRLTGLGGYYIYTVLAKKLGLNPRGIEDFDVEHLTYDYYGNLYDLSPYRKVAGDRVSAYRFAAQQRSYTVTHYDVQGDGRQYYTLYPKSRQQLFGAQEAILGGVSPVVDIEIDSPQKNYNQLLIFGDDSMQSYLPFLLVHYARVTFVDAANVTPALLERIDPADYKQILFAFSADHYVTQDLMSGLFAETPD